jgi:outer membrane protein OmpA-like peptidoglycan-associated protein/outer membrane murein-binding lipoprotein Lpp
MRTLLAAVIVTPALLLAGCATTPKENSQITELQRQIDNLDSGPEGKQYAPIAVREAQESLNRLKSFKGSSEEYKHQLFLTEKRIDIARETVSQKQAEETVASAESRRKDILLDAAQQETANARNLAATMAGRAQELEQQVTDLQAQETERGLVLTLGAVLFETNKATLQSGSQRTVQKVAEFLNQYPERKILIEGFTDSQGSDSYNQKLSQDRAQAVRNELAKNGVSAQRIDIVGYGEEYPVASNDNAAGRQQNRRVEIVVSKENGADVTNRTTMNMDD